MTRTGAKAHGVLMRLVHSVIVIAVTLVMLFVGVPGAQGQAMTAETYWVDTISGSNTTGDGSETKPWRTITHAVSQSDELDMIMVAEGTYSEASGEDWPLHLYGQSLVAAYGPAVTILSGNGTGETLIFNDWDDGDQLNGFTIENGGAAGGTAAAVMLILARPTAFPTEPMVRECTFSNNAGGYEGGALAVNSMPGSTLVVQSNQFWDNSARDGAAFRATTYGSLVITSNEFSRNTAIYGGAIDLYTAGDAMVTLEGNTFTLNSANTAWPETGTGGAVRWTGFDVTASAAHQMLDNQFISNTATVGGVLSLTGIALHMDGNEAGNNSASSMGSFAYLEDADVTAENNYLAQNTGANNGIVWSLDANSTLAEVNDTVVGNQGAQYAAYAPASAGLTIANCIYWNPDLNGASIGGVSGADSISYSCSSDDLATLTGAGNAVGPGMVYAEPVYHTDGPPRIAQNSPCVDAGTPAGAPSRDFFGTARPLDGNGDRVALPDIGCYEAPAVAPPYVPVVVYRFFHYRNGTHFYTADPDERVRVIANWSSIYRDEGVAYVLNAASATQPLYRFFNLTNGSHFYTADPTERDRVRANWPTIYRYEGETYWVSPVPVPGATTVYRFFKYGTGSHFYTADPTERDRVIANWPTLYRYEGEAFWLAP